MDTKQVLWNFGFEWKSKITVYGLPLVHIAFGKDSKSGKLLVAKGIIAIGQFGLGVITIAQFGVGVLLGIGQFAAGVCVLAQFAGGIYFGLGQFATGVTAIGQFAIGEYVLAQIGYGKYVYSSIQTSVEALSYFKELLPCR